MQLKKINYISFFLSNLALFLLQPLWVEQERVHYIAIIMLGVLIYEAILVFSLRELFQSKLSGNYRSKLFGGLGLLIKFLVLALVFYIGVKWFGDSIYIPLTVYILQLLILVLHIKNISMLA